jgi:DNA-binding transcriptional regulator YiaG
MTPAQFKAAREALCLSQNDLAEVWGMGDNGGRTIRRWERGERPLNPVAAYCIKLMLERE